VNLVRKIIEKKKTERSKSAFVKPVLRIGIDFNAGPDPDPDTKPKIEKIDFNY
jgi:hypothetical protein